MSDETTTKTGFAAAIATAIVAAQAAARAVAKDSKNEFHKYRYASAEAMIIEAREALSAAGLALLTMGWQFIASSATRPEVDQDGKQRATVIGRVEVAYRLVHKSGETLDLDAGTPVVVEKGRPADKAEFAALTANLAYVLRGLLLLPRDDEQASIDARDDRGYEPPAQSRTEERRQEDAKPPATPPADDERATWKALADELARRIHAMTDRRVLKDTMVPEVAAAKKNGMPRDLVEWLVRDVYTPHAESLEQAQKAAA